MRDQYWWGDVARISPEAPVPVVQVMREEERFGAASNVIANIVALGGITHRATCQTSRKIRLVARNQQVARIDFDKQPTEEEIKWMEHFFVERLQDADPPSIVVFSDYGKGTLKNIQKLIDAAKTAGKTVLVDPKGHDYSRYAGADLVKPNLDEMRSMVGGWSSEDQLMRKVTNLMAEARIERILLTRGAQGMSLFHSTGNFTVQAEAREVYDVTGAGDTAIATLAVALNNGCSWPDAVRYANKAAGIVVGKFGTSVATKDEVFNDAA